MSFTWRSLNVYTTLGLSTEPLGCGAWTRSAAGYEVKHRDAGATAASAGSGSSLQLQRLLDSWKDSLIVALLVQACVYLG